MPPEKLGLPKLSDEPIPSLSERVHGGIYKAGIAPIALYAAFAYVTWKNRGKGDAGEEKKP
jgi:hypothetical protein